MAAARFRPLTPAVLAGIEDPCRHCGYPTRTANRNGQALPGMAHTGNGGAPVQPDWSQEVTDLWGLCGVSAHLNGDVAGYLTFAPAELVPSVPLPGIGGNSADAFSPNAAVVMAIEICQQHRRHGLGRNLVRSAVAQLAKRQIGQVEAIGTFVRPGVPYADGNAHPSMILLPVGFWQAVGFRIIRPHPSTPTLRLEVSSTVRWLPDFAAAWRRFADLLSEPPAQPAGFEHRRETVGETRREARSSTGGRLAEWTHQNGAA